VKLLGDRFVLIASFGSRGYTTTAVAAEYAPPEFLLDLLDSTDRKIQRKTEHLNWPSIDMDGDTPWNIAKRRDNAKIHEIGHPAAH